jgi:DNA-binding MarR family transcriptional regulator
MITKDEEVRELRHALGRIMRGMWSRRRPTPELLELVEGRPRLSRRHVALLAQVGAEGSRTVSDLAEALGVSLPAASKLTRELEEHQLVERREDPEDRRRTIVTLNEATAKAVNEWLGRRNLPLETALASLDATERAAFLKGLNALADALMEESAHGPLRSHHRPPHRRRSHRHRSV